MRDLPTLQIRNFVVDSGAFTAHSSGKPIKVEDYRDAIMKYRDLGLNPAEIFSLDVIGDGLGTAKNTEWLWGQGIEAIPAFHYGEPEDLLIRYATQYPKIALGGAVGLSRKEKERWARQCFARIWPKPVHGFGFGIWALDVLPFHSIDCSDWFGAAKRFGSWNSYGRIGLGLGGQNVVRNIAAEVQFWLDAETRARKKWSGTFEALGWIEEGNYQNAQEATT